MHAAGALCAGFRTARKVLPRKAAGAGVAALFKPRPDGPCAARASALEAGRNGGGSWPCTARASSSAVKRTTDGPECVEPALYGRSGPVPYACCTVLGCVRSLETGKRS